MDEIALVKLQPLMRLSEGNPKVVIALLDGPVDISHPNLSHETILSLPGKVDPNCSGERSTACEHGTSVASILSAKRGSAAPAICPKCTLLVRPVFSEYPRWSEQIPRTTLTELAHAIIDCIHAGARIINISAAAERPSAAMQRIMEEALDYACQEGVLVFAAAGNQGTLGSSLITRHSWVVSVSACDSRGEPLGFSNLGASISRNGLMAPGIDITTLSVDGRNSKFSGTSAAVPFVSGTAALLWSVFPQTDANSIRFALLSDRTRRARTVVPAVLDALVALKFLERQHGQNILTREKTAI